MMTLPTAGNIYLHRHPTDMRKSFDGLAGIIRGELGRDPTEGSLFLFVNRRRDRIKAMYFDRDGLALWYKRLEQGTFEWLSADDDDARAIQIDAMQLALILGGVSLGSARRRKRFSKVA